MKSSREVDMKKLAGVFLALMFFLFCIVAVLMAKENASFPLKSLSWLLVAASWKKFSTPDPDRFASTSVHPRFRLRSAGEEPGNETVDPASTFFDHRHAK